MKNIKNNYKIITLYRPNLINNDNFWKDFDALSDKMDRLPQLNSSWLVPFIKYRLKKSEPFIFAAYLNDKLVGCLPLQKRMKKATRFWNYTVFEFLGYGPTDFYNIIAQNNALDIKIALVEHFLNTQKWDYLRLDLLPSNSDLNSYLQHKLSANKKLQIRFNHLTGYHYEITKDVEAESYYNEVFKKKNKDLLKGERRLENDNIEYKIIKHHSGIYNKFIDNVKLYADRRKTLGQYNFYEDESYCQFLAEVCINYENKKCIEFSTLETKDGDVIAIQLDFIKNKVRYHWNHAFNEEYKRYSPGKILLKELLLESITENKIDECNHMRGLSSYKEKFTSHTSHFINYEIVNQNSLTVKTTKMVSKVLQLLK